MFATQFTALLGLAFGIIGTILGVLNYRRDKPKLHITLQYDRSIYPPEPSAPDALYGLITVVNTGRRPICITHVTLQLPPGFEETHLLIPGGTKWIKLGEGDPAHQVTFRQDALLKYATAWQHIIAHVTDSSGKEWKSKPVSKDRVPS